MTIFESTTKKKQVVRIFSWENRDKFPKNWKFFRLELKISATGFTTPQTSNQIDAAVLKRERQLSAQVSAICEKTNSKTSWTLYDKET